MQSKTSCFNRTLFRKNMTRSWPVWAAYAVLWLLVMPQELSRIMQREINLPEMTWQLHSALGDLMQAGIVITAVAAVIFAMVHHSYLYQARSTGFYHSLPVRREGLYFNSFLSGMAGFLIGHVITLAVGLVLTAVMGCPVVWPLIVWFLAVTGMALFFYGFASFIAMVTGQILALPVFYVIFNFLAVGVELLVRTVCDCFLFGFVGVTADKTFLLSPALQLGRELDVKSIYNNLNADGTMTELSERIGTRLEGWEWVLIYAIVGVVFLLLGLALYRRRKSETAGDLVAVRGLRPVFLYGVGFCGALSLGYAFYLLIWRGPDSLAAILICYLAAGFIGWLAAQMLLRKTFRVFDKKSWGGFAVLAAGIIVVLGCIGTDAGGYESRIPAAEEVKVVTLWTHGVNESGSAYADEADDIARLMAFHQSVVDNREELKNFDWGEFHRYDTVVNSDTDWRVVYDQTGSVNVELNYELTDGSLIRREYTIPVSRELRETPGDPANALSAVFDADWRLENSFPAEIETDDVQAGLLWGDRGRDAITFTQEESQALYEAYCADVAAGRTGQFWFQQDEEWYNTVYQNELELTFAGYYPSWGDADGQSNLRSVTLRLETGATATIAALEAAGVDTEAVLKTMLEFHFTDEDGKYYQPDQVIRDDAGIDADLYYEPMSETAEIITEGEYAVAFGITAVD